MTNDYKPLKSGHFLDNYYAVDLCIFKIHCDSPQISGTFMNRFWTLMSQNDTSERINVSKSDFIVIQFFAITLKLEY